MIIAKSLKKGFENILAVDDVSFQIEDSSVFALIGTNGSGKSTILSMLSGVLRTDRGEILLDGENIFENITQKSKLFYISDDQYFFPNSTPNELKNFYKQIYHQFDEQRFNSLLDAFSLNPYRKISTFSKGMKKQLSVIYALSAMTDYILCDETFDGLDPVVRQGVKGIFANDIAERGLSVIIASHNLRELEDVCDHVVLLHQGHVILDKNLDDLKDQLHKIQCAFQVPMTADHFSELSVESLKQSGSLYTLVVRGNREEIMRAISDKAPLFAETIPLSLEEIFINETEVYGYDVKKILL